MLSRKGEKMIKFPNYDESILSIASSVLKHFNVKDCPHSTLKEFDELLDKNYENIIVMLFDGMGYYSIQNHLDENDFLKKHLVKSISSVFPPTTVCATTTIESGYAPIEHSWLGWDLYFKEIGENVSVFRNTLQRNGEKAADYYVAGKFAPHDNIFNRIENANKKVKVYYVSPFSKYKIDTLDDVGDMVLKLAKKKGRKYIYTYWAEPDHTMHIYGVNSKEAKSEIFKINNFVENLCSKLNNSVVVVTADHGLIDSKSVYLEYYPNLWNMLKIPPSIEPRALSLFVKDGMAEVFKTEFENTFKDKFILLTKQEIYDRHMFGYGKPHSKADDFIGDYIAVAVSDLTIFNYEEEKPFIGVHAGLDEREMLVPFIAAECI